MRLCINCRWHKDGYCLSPQNKPDRANLVTGKTGNASPGLGPKTCAYHRHGALTSWLGCRLNGVCGAEGRWFTPKENP